jgi:hypothetical protein
VKPWLAIPIVGMVAATIAGFLGASGGELVCAALAGAAVVHALRAAAGDSPAAIAGACAGALLAVVTVAELGITRGSHDLALAWLALGAASWTFAELSRPTETPYVALAPAIAAAIVEPACVALVAIAGARLVTARSSRPVIEAALRAQLDTGESGQLPLPHVASGKHAIPRELRGRGESAKHRGESAKHARPAIKPPARRAGWSPHWVIAAPLLGVVLVVVAIVAGTARDGALGSLAEVWYGPRLREASPVSSITSLGEALGPLAVVATLAGIAVLARVHLASLAIISCALGALLCDLRTGAPGAFTLGFASLCAGAGIARLAGMIRLRSGQAIAAATCGAMLLVPPVWTVIG